MKGKSQGSLFLTLLAVAFIVLRLTGTIDWAWTWVLAPIWIPIALGLIVAIIGAFTQKDDQDRG